MNATSSIKKGATPVLVFTALVLLAAWALNHLGGGEPGLPFGGAGGIYGQAAAGGGDERSALQVAIHGDRYVIGRRQRRLEQVVAAGKRAGLVQIIAYSDARIGAEQELKNALDQAHVHWNVVESGPNTGP